MHLKENVEKLAYELYERNGRHEGRELLDWLAAEQIIRFQQMICSGMERNEVGLLEYKPLSAEESISVTPAASNTRPQFLTGQGRRKVALGKR